MLTVTGKLKKLVFFLIHHNDSMQIRDSSRIWGKGIIETEQIIKDQLGMEDVQIASVGPAGEKRVFSQPHDRYTSSRREKRWREN